MTHPFFKPKTGAATPLLSTTTTPTTDTSRRSSRNTSNAGKSSRLVGGKSTQRNKPFGQSFRGYVPPPPPAPVPSTATRLPSNSSHPAQKPTHHDEEDRDNDPASPHTQVSPYPESVGSSSTPHPLVTIGPVRTVHVPALMRTTGLLLPVRYPHSFYSATITDPIVASVSRVAVYHERDPATGNGKAASPSCPTVSSSDKVIGAIRCRLEPLGDSPGHQTANSLYIQALHLLSPYRGNGIATALFESIVYDNTASSGPTSPNSSSSQPQRRRQRRLSPIVKHYNIRTVSAHVHETNEDALAWYTSRGFSIQDGVVQGYYRRLKPTGAKIVKLELDWGGDDEDTESTSVDPTLSTGRDITGCAVDSRADDDDDWEKIEMEECNSSDQTQDHDTVDRRPELGESSRKKIRSS